MTTYVSTPHLHIVAIVLVAACDLEGALPATDDVSLKSRSSDLQEVQEISTLVLERFHSRGVTVEEAEAVAASGDEEAALELLGMSAAESRRLYNRYIAAHERIERGESRGSGGSGGRGGGIGGIGDGNPSQNITFGTCSRGYGACLLVAGVGGALTGNPGSGLVVIGLGAFACYCASCSGGITAYICF